MNLQDKPIINPTSVYSKAETLVLLNIKRKLFERLIKEGKLPSTKLGTRLYRFLGSDIIKFLQEAKTV